MATRTASRPRTQVRRKKGPLWWRITKILLSLGALVAMVGATVMGIIFLMAFKNAEGRIAALWPKLDDQESVRTVIWDSQQKSRLYVATSEYRRPILDYNEIPKVVIDTTLAAEDKRFFTHDGVDVQAVLRSVFINVRDRGISQGASTISMQVSKMLFTNAEQTFQRKLDDASMAIQMERMITKREILRTYLNRAYYGQGAHGVRAAAEIYFGKALNKLTLSEAALLARCVRRPSDQNPFVNLKAALHNRDVVLGIMREEGMITQAEYEKALNEKVKLQPKTFMGGERILKYPYYTRYVIDFLKRELPDIDITKGGYTIITNLDMEIQDAAAAAVARTVRRQRGLGVRTGAVVVMRNTGEVLAMQGGVDYERNRFNVVYQGRRQPGSSFKPFVYAAGLSTNAISPYRAISNEMFSYRGYTPKNSSRGGYGGAYMIPDALAQSVNVPAVRAMAMTGPETAANFVSSTFGFSSKIHPYLSTALGASEVSPLEMLSAYSVFQTGGDRVVPYPVLKVIDQRTGETVKSWSGERYPNVLDAGVANYLDDCMRAVVTRGTGREASSIPDARGKTGTTQENKDAWFCGYTNKLVAVAWIANEQKEGDRWVYRPMSSYAMGGTIAVDIWRDTMRAAVAREGRGQTRNRRGTITSDAVDVNATVDRDRNETDEDRAAREAERAAEREAARRERDAEKERQRNEPAPTEPEAPRDEQPKTEPRREQPKADEPRAERTVSVDVCADTGQRATLYCPETVRRELPANRVPRRCTRHVPPR